MFDIVTLAAVIVLAYAFGAQTGWLLTRNYYKRREQEQEHSRETHLLREVIRELKHEDSGKHFKS